MPKYELTDHDVAEINRIRDKVDGMRFSGLTGYNGPTAIVVGPVQFPAPIIAGGNSTAGDRLVKLSNPTGSAGSNATPSAPTYVYDISDPATGATIATAVPVLFARQIGHVTAGTWGLAKKVATTVGGTPAWNLFVVDEVYDAVEGCS